MPGSVSMAKNMMRTANTVQSPAHRFNFTDKVCAFHCVYDTHLWSEVKLKLSCPSRSNSIVDVATLVDVGRVCGEDLGEGYSAGIDNIAT